jgi:hypothetical protein
MGSGFLDRSVVGGVGLTLVLLSALTLLTVGCNAPGGLRDDVVTVYHFYRVPPWVYSPEGRVNGLLPRVYFVPAGDDKGFFVPGAIHATLHVRTRRPDGTYERTLVHEWRFDPKQAEGFRIVKRSTLGDSYGFVLRWPDELNLSGREIEIRFSYVRQDGRVIQGRPTPLPEPVPSGAPPPASQAAPPPKRVETSTRPAAPPREKQ